MMKAFFLFFIRTAWRTSTAAHLIPQPPEENTGDKNVSAISVTVWRVCQLGEVFCSLCLAGKSHPHPSAPPDPVNDWSHAVTAGTIIYSRSALVIKGCEGAPREKEFVQKECLWNGYIYGLVLHESSHRDGFVAQHSSVLRSKRGQIWTGDKHNSSLSLNVML